MKKVRLGKIHADHVSFSQAIDRIAELVEAKGGGFVVTPNVDHVVLAETSDSLCQAYANASLSLIDGMPLLWLTHLLGHPLPEKISGSDLVRPLIARAAVENWRVYFFGAAPGVADRASSILLKDYPGFAIAGTDSPPMGFLGNSQQEQHALDKIRSAKPDLLLLALGCPAQELLMDQWREHLKHTVAMGIGGTLDFIAGAQKRAPAWMANAGLEWFYRLANDPKRMAQRYLVRDRAIGKIALRMLRQPKPERAFFA